MEWGPPPAILQGEPPLQKGEVVCLGDGKSGVVARAYPMEDKYAVKQIGTVREIRGPDGSFFYFCLADLRRAVPLAPSPAELQAQPAQPVLASGEEGEPPLKQPRVESAAQAVGPFAGQGGPQRMEGRVKWYVKEKGFGKIAPVVGRGQAPAEEVFVLRKQMEGGQDGPHAQAIAEGSLVTYEVTTGIDGKPLAAAVQVEGVARALASLEEKGDREAVVRQVLMAGMQHGVFQVRGVGKSTMEDRFLARSGVVVDTLGASCRKSVCAFFGVFDGHSGPSCSEFVSTALDRSVFDCLRHQSKRDITSEMSIRSALLAGFRTTEHNFFQYVNRLEGGASLAWATAGSTACTVCFFGPDEEGRLRLAVANAGDSRAVLGKRDGRTVRLSEDHQPDVPSERKRIEAEGASVVQAHGGIWRIVLPKKHMSLAGLSVSRGFGDLEYKQPAAVVSAVPDVTISVVDVHRDAFVVLMSDGITNSVQDYEVTRIVATGLRDGSPGPGGEHDACGHAAQLLVEEAHRRDGHDDKTALVIWFGELPEASGDAAKQANRRVNAHAMAPTMHVAAQAAVRAAAGDDMFAIASEKPRAAPGGDMDDLDNLFTAYANEIKPR